MPALVPAELAFAGDGTPWSAAYGDIYHSGHGGLDQARHVFLGGNQLLGESARWHSSPRFTILETGFGLGLNFLATWQAWQQAGNPGQLHFISVEKHPFRRDDLARLLAGFPYLASEAAILLQHWPCLAPGFHRLHFGRITLSLLLGDAEKLLPQLRAQVDAFYLDGFAPAKNPELWSPALLATLTRLAAPSATLATWSVAGELRRSLERLGWQIERRPGFGNKREMLSAQRTVAEQAVPSAPTFTAERAEIAGKPAPTCRSGLARDKPSGETCVSPRRAIVIGAGLAGVSISEALARRGWQIELFERGPGPATAASGNPAGILLPLPAKDDALAARLSRACYLYALHRLSTLPGVRWSPCGVLQLGRDADHEAHQRATVHALQLPPEFVRYLSRSEAEALVSHPLHLGGWWFPSGGWVSPASFCAALLAAAGEQVRPHYHTPIASLIRSQDGWQVLDSAGQLVASAPHVVLANAYEANALIHPHLPLTPVRGQISYLPSGSLSGIHHVICRGGYLTPPAAGTVCIGASFDKDDTDLRPRLADHIGNVQRLEDILPGSTASLDATTLPGRTGVRTTTLDRMPLIGTLPDTDADRPRQPTLANLPRQNGLHTLIGLGARGMVYAPLAAELLASQLEGEPLPLEQLLVQAVDPARFYLRQLRRGSH